MYYELDFCSKHLGFFSEETFQKFPDLCWNIVLRQNPLAASSQPRKLHSQFSHILLWIPGSDRERKRGSTAIFFPRKKDGNIVLQHLKTCTQGQPEEKNWKGTQTLTSFENYYFYFFFPKCLSLWRYYYFIHMNFQQTKLAGKSRAMQTLDNFFFASTPKTQWDKKRIEYFLHTIHSLKTGLYLAWIKHGATLITTQDLVL